ncbi:hypothetical protein [Mycobacterium deserti]|uniref:Low molecular weight antigen MTB12-like C-terminal domain-containing protein n=1 Tax=Mycobacterium deserti TaxID=2978347 RepID=A0ABT2MCV2_9MYCO|nr:hypothetical protein [Mycobacterium deserti]MCT7660102.1 hypothetical protein [Mycobacterium deserti]
MTLKTLVTGVAAIGVVGAAAAGVTSLVSPAVSAAPAVQSVVWDTPMPLQPMPCNVTPDQLRSVIDGLLAPGVPARTGKSDLVEGGVGFSDGALADRAIKKAYANGSLPVAYDVSAPVCNGPTVSATLSAKGQTMNAAFVPGGRFGWSLSRASATQALSLFG